MDRDKLFKKYYKSKFHDYEIEETISSSEQPIDIAFVYSGRNRGKSFEISSQLIADAWYDKRLFGYIRRNDATVFDVEQYFQDKCDFIKDMTDGLYNGITRQKGKLKFYKDEVDTETGESHRIYGEDCGYFFALSRQASYKSLQYPEVYNLIYEEVLTDGTYLSSEPEKLMNLYSTVRRSKDNFRMWLVSNTVSVVNPYSNSWGIYLAKNKPGDIRLSKLYLGSTAEDGTEQYLLIAAHYLQDKNTLSKEELKKKKRRIRTAISSNKWDELKLFSVIGLKFMRQYSIEETVVFEFDDLMFQGDIVEVPNNIFDIYSAEEEDEVPISKDFMPILYIRRKTSEPYSNTRVYTNNAERMSEYVSKGFKIIYNIDKAVDELLKRGWVIGADNLTMNDFYTILGKLRLIR